ncbi:MAG: hypothetical protein FWE92_02565 [Defluviitaleaceae bacterium]|nr:hypothetical protein [Defluviitaleaceae bacterium]
MLSRIKCFALLFVALFLLASCDATDIAEESATDECEYTADKPLIDEPIINEQLWLDRFTRGEVWQMVLDADDMITRVLGAPVDLHGPDSLLIGRRYIIASGTANIPIWDRVITQEADIFFLPTTVDNDIALWLVAYDIDVHTGLERNQLTAHFNPESFFDKDEDTITVRFTRAYDDGRPVFYHVEENLSRDVTIDEINRLMRLHTGQQVMDIWFCRDVCHRWRYTCLNPNKLYINIYPVDFVFFDWGSTGSYMRGRQLIDTFLGFPGAEEIEVLVNGSAGAATSHFCFGQIFRRDWSVQDY